MAARLRDPVEGDDHRGTGLRQQQGLRGGGDVADTAVDCCTLDAADFARLEREPPALDGM